MESLILKMLKVSEFLHTNEKLMLASAVDSALTNLLKLAAARTNLETFLKSIDKIVTQYNVPFTAVATQLYEKIKFYKEVMRNMEADPARMVPSEFTKTLTQALDELKKSIDFHVQHDSADSPLQVGEGHERTQLQYATWGRIMEKEVNSWRAKYIPALESTIKKDQSAQ